MDAEQIAFGFSVAAFLFCASNIIYMHIHGYTVKTNNRLFLCMLYILTINSISVLLSAVMDINSTHKDIFYTIRETSRYVYFVTHTALCPLLFFYVSSIVGRSFRENKMGTFLRALPFLVSEILVLVNPIFHFVWYVDEAKVFHRNIGEGIIYAIAAVYYVAALVLILTSWRFLTSRRKTTLLYCFVLVLVGVMIQLFFKWLRVEVLFEAIGFTGAMISLENEDDRMNASIGVYNRQALGVDMEAALKNYRSLFVVVLRITNKDTVTRLTGSENTNVLYKQVSVFLKKVVPSYSVYSANPGVFVLVLYHMSEEETEEIVRCIDERFHQEWKVGEVDVPLTAVLMKTEIPARINTVSDVFYMTDSPLPSDLEKTILEKNDLEFLLRREAVEQAVARGIEENSFSVYYQPTYHIDGTIHGAEALLRMHDRELGDVYPDEFIPVAEQMGYIDAVDDYVLHEVCQFIRSGIPHANGMDGINVNLSVLECMKSGFVEHINDIVEKAGIEKDYLNFEITESVAAADYKILRRVVKELKKEGFLFSMDDYGTGYSNMSAIFSLNLDVIKIDKSILWNAEKSEMGRIILENSIHMIRQMKKKILVEGVETEEQVRHLRELGVDYLQGYYFSKPLPKDEFIALIKKNG